MISLPILIFVGCVEETWPELDISDESILVVEGRITNYPGPYTIKLSTTRSLELIPSETTSENDIDPYRDADVKIVDEFDNYETLTEIEPGIYQTAEGGIQGVIGRSYKVSIVSPDGETYESDFEKILDPVGIDTVFTEKATVDEVIDGFQFYITTELSTIKENYYLWELSETYEYHTPYVPSHYYEGEFTNSYYDGNGIFHRGSPGEDPPYNLPEYNPPVDLSTCFLTQDIESTYKQSTKYLSEARVTSFPLHFIHYTNFRTRVKYSLLVKQHSVSEKAYKYFDEIDEQNSYDENELYTKQPYQMRGNIRNINNPDEPVLGYFYTSGISGKRMFAPADPRLQNEKIYSNIYCQTASLPSVRYGLIPGAEDVPSNIITDYIGFIEDRSSAWPVYFGRAHIFYADLMPWDWPNWFVAYNYDCIDCREKGGVLQMPAYWE